MVSFIIIIIIIIIIVIILVIIVVVIIIVVIIIVVIIIVVIIIVVIIIGSTTLGGLWHPRANVASDLYPGHPPANFYNPVYLRLPLPRSVHFGFGRPCPR